MKKVLFVLLMFTITSYLQAQTVIFHENFDPPSNSDSVNVSGPVNNFALNNRLYYTSPQCDSSQVPQNDMTLLATDPFTTLGCTSVLLTFSHICKIEATDTAWVMVSVNNASYYRLTAAEYINPGNSQFAINGNIFNSDTYPLDWLPAQNTAKPDQSWWKNETFEIGNIVGNFNFAKIGFLLKDGNGNGSNLNHGWYIDNILINCSTGVGIENNNHGNTISISPNPFTTSTQITLPQTFHNIALAVYDIQGKLLAQHQYKDCSQIQLNRNQLSNGLYFLKLTLDDKEVETGKIIVSEE
jgi:hypothetical protein